MSSNPTEVKDDVQERHAKIDIEEQPHDVPMEEEHSPTGTTRVDPLEREKIKWM